MDVGTAGAIGLGVSGAFCVVRHHLGVHPDSDPLAPAGDQVDQSVIRSSTSWTRSTVRTGLEQDAPGSHAVRV